MKIIKYKFLSCRINHGTEEEPDYEQVFLDKVIECSDAAFDSNYAIAQAEAYNGEVTVVDGPPDPEPAEDDSVWEELDAAYQRGVDSV